MSTYICQPAIPAYLLTSIFVNPYICQTTYLSSRMAVNLLLYQPTWVWIWFGSTWMAVNQLVSTYMGVNRSASVSIYIFVNLHHCQPVFLSSCQPTWVQTYLCQPAYLLTRITVDLLICRPKWGSTYMVVRLLMCQHSTCITINLLICKSARESIFLCQPYVST